MVEGAFARAPAAVTWDSDSVLSSLGPQPYVVIPDDLVPCSQVTDPVVLDNTVDPKPQRWP